MGNRSQMLPEDQKHRYILFVSGMSVKSTRAIDNFKHMCDEYLEDNFELQIIDISRDHSAARDYQIVAIPTLMRISPEPRKIILGDLSNKQKVLAYLDLI